MLKHFAGRSIETAQLFNELVLRQVVGDRLRLRYMRGATPGNKQVKRLRALFVLQYTSQFKEDHRSEAVAEDDERPVQMGCQGLIDKRNQRGEIRARCLFQPAAAPWKLDRQYFYGRRQVARPIAKNKRPAAGIRKTE